MKANSLGRRSEFVGGGTLPVGAAKPLSAKKSKEGFNWESSNRELWVRVEVKAYKNSRSLAGKDPAQMNLSQIFRMITLEWINSNRCDDDYQWQTIVVFFEHLLCACWVLCGIKSTSMKSLKQSFNMDATIIPCYRGGKVTWSPVTRLGSGQPGIHTHCVWLQSPGSKPPHTWLLGAKVIESYWLSDLNPHDNTARKVLTAPLL